MSQRLLAASAALLLCACGSASSSPDAGVPDAGPNVADRACAEQSGSRILLRKHVAPDGAFVRQNLWDDQLGVACEVARYGGGDVGTEGMYCVPATTTGTVYFADGACTEPYISFMVNDPYSFGLEYDAAACPRAPVAYAAGAELAARPGAAYLRDGQGDCQPTAMPGGVYYAVDRRIDTDELVAMSEDTVGEGRVVQRRFTGTDGSVVCGSPHDQVFAADCSLRETDVLGSYQCSPIGRGVRELFTDDACTAGVSAVELGECPDDARTHASSPAPQSNECGFRPALVSELEAPNTDPHYVRVEGVCQPIGTPGITTFAPAGAEVDPASLPVFAYADEVAATRLRRRYLASEDGLAVFDELWYDSALDIECRVRPLTMTGVPYCLPSYLPSAGGAYTDAACTRAMSGFIDSRVDCHPAPKYAVVDPSGTGTPEIWSVELREDPAYTFTVDGCAVADGPAYDLVEEVGLSAFVRFESVIE